MRWCVIYKQTGRNIWISERTISSDKPPAPLHEPYHVTLKYMPSKKVYNRESAKIMSFTGPV